jgi:probable phosphoglycerate mutase
LTPPRTSVLLIRHGETVWNGEGRIQGHLDSALSATGRAQARALGARIAAEGIDFIASSDLGRALATAAAIADVTDLEVVVDSRLRERSFGALEGMTWPEIARAFPDDYAHLSQRDPAHRPPGGESAIEFRDRVFGCVTELAQGAPGARIAIVVHGGVLSMFYRHARGLGLDAPRDYTLANASINRFALTSDGWTLESWAEVGHLEGVVQDDIEP